MNAWAWIFIGGFLLVIGTIMIGYGWHKMPEKKTADIQQVATGDDNTQIATTGDNSPAIVGDATVNYGSSIEDIKAAIREVSQENAEPLHMKYGSNYTVAAITPDCFIVPKDEVPSGITVKWETGRVIHMSSGNVKILSPEITVNIDHLKDGYNAYIAGNIFVLPKKIGAKITLLRGKGFSVSIEVIGIDQNLVIVGLGLAPIVEN